MMNKEMQDKAFANLQIKELNAMQLEACKSIIQNNSTTLLAPTGSGKTLAFLLPILQLLQPNQAGVQCLILAPSRELAIQIESVWKKMQTGFKSNICYGGHAFETEKNNLSQAPALLIGTPGRIADHISRSTFDWSNIETLVLDEFDKSLELGFQAQMAYIISFLKKIKKRVLVSATADIEIPAFAGIHQANEVNYLTPKNDNKNLVVKIVESDDKDKLQTLENLLCYCGAQSTIIFCNHRDAVERTSHLLNTAGIHNEFFHGGIEQLEREKALVKFRNGSTYYLIASDLASRGLDIPEVKNIIHYHMPNTLEAFIHRNGRTARMNANGTVYIVKHAEEQVPSFINDELESIHIPSNLPLPTESKWITLYINAGKKHKVNKIDIVGFLGNIGKVPKAEIGLIEVMDYVSFVAVNKDLVKDILANVREQKMKGKKYIFKIDR